MLMTRNLRAVLLGAVMVVGAAVCFGRGATFAEGSARVNMVASIEEVLSVEAGYKTVKIVPSMDGTFGADNIFFQVRTNASAGYTGSMTPSSTDLTLSGGSATIPTLGTGSFTQLNFTVNRWGIAINGGLFSDGTNYHAIASGTTQLINENGPGSEEINISYGAKLNLETAEGEYSTTITFEAVAKISPKTIYDLVYMQDYGRLTKSEQYSVAQSMTVGDQYRLIDSRDNKMYFITKQADGHLWMTQNLDLALSSGVQLTSLDTNINEYGSGLYVTGYGTAQGGEKVWLPPATAATSSYHINFQGEVSPTFTMSDTFPYSIEGGDIYVYHGISTRDFVYDSMDDCKRIGHTDAECSHYHVGNYYNWTAAVASSDSSGWQDNRYQNAANSICPLGWYLPRGRAQSDNATTRIFGQLFLTSGVTSSLTGTSYASNGFDILTGDPLYFVRAGYADNTVIGNINDITGFVIDGYYWSRTAGRELDVYGMNFDQSSLASASIFSRGYAMTIRCMGEVPASP